MAARRSANAARPAAGTSPPAVTSVTAATIASYQPSTAPVSVSRRPSEWVTTAAASGPAKARRSSASPAGSTASISRSTSAATSSVKRSRTACRRNGRANGARWRWCSSPSSVSMLGPTTRPVEKRGSSTVKVAASPMTCSARSRRRTSQPPSAGSHDDRRALAQAGEQRMSVRRRQGLDGDRDLLVIGGGVMGLLHGVPRVGAVRRGSSCSSAGGSATR